MPLFSAQLRLCVDSAASPLWERKGDDMLATEQDTETHIMGSGCLGAYPWYVHATADTGYSYDAEFNAPDGWSIGWEMWDGEHDDDQHTKVVTINHDRLIDTMRLIADGNVHNVGTATETECERFLTDPWDADFDADTADQVLQVLAYGEVVYG